MQRVARVRQRQLILVRFPVPSMQSLVLNLLPLVVEEKVTCSYSIPFSQNTLSPQFELFSWEVVMIIVELIRPTQSQCWLQLRRTFLQSLWSELPCTGQALCIQNMLSFSGARHILSYRIMKHDIYHRTSAHNVSFLSWFIMSKTMVGRVHASSKRPQ